MSPRVQRIVFLVAICVAIHHVTSSSSVGSEVRGKRSDDGGPLEVVVAQLSQQVSTLNSKVAALETKTNAMDKMVAFHAYNSVSPITVLAHGTLILNTADTNIANAYDKSTGVFTAPVAGLYDLQGSGMGEDRTTHAMVSIYMEGRELSRCISDNSHHPDWDHCTTRTLVHLSQGAKVTLRNTENSQKQYHGYTYTAFSGFLIKADA